MVDTYVPLAPTLQAASIELAEYQDSWRTPGAQAS